MADTGGTVETEVDLIANGGPVFRAFNQIDARMKNIQGMVDAILVRAKAAAEAFGGANLKTIQNFEKVIGTFDKFERTIQKNDPLFVKQQQIDAAYAAIDKRAAQSANKRVEQESQLWARYERDRYNSAESREKRLEKIGEDRVARINAVQMQGDREADRLREQNSIKALKDRAKQQVQEAKSVQELENIRVASATHIADLRTKRDNGTETERRAALQMLSVEQERNRLAEARIKSESAAVARAVTGRDAQIDQGLNVRTARNAEQELAATLNLGAARSRQAEIEASIAYQIERTRVATGLEKVEAERLLKVEEARLGIIRQRVRALETELARNVALGKKAEIQANKPTSSLFGATGVGGIIARTAAYGGAAAAIYGTISAIQSGISYAIQFDDAIARLGAISGATSTQQVELAKTIADVGKESRFSTLDLAAAATTLAQAGFTQQEIAQSLKGISQLATASGTSIQEATDVATSAIGAFNLQASELPHINDVLSSALNRTKLNMQQVALGIQYAGATAHENKISFEELTAVMAVMANAGIKSGSTIGTGIRQFLVDLQTPTKKLAEEMKHLGLSMADIDVDRLGLPEVLHRLAAAGFDSAAAYKTLETRAAAAYLVLRNNRNAINEQIIAQNQVGQSAEAAAKGQASLAAEWQRTKNIIDSTIHDQLEGTTNALRNYLKAVNDYNSDPAVKKLLERDDTRALPGIGLETNAALQDYLRLKAELNAAEAEYADRIEASTTAFNKATDEVGKQRNALASLDDATARVYVRQKELSSNQIAMQAEVSSLTARFQGLAGYLNGTMIPTWDQLTSAVRAYRLEQLRALGTALQSQALAARQQADAFRGQANAITQVGLSDGLFGRLPKNVQDLYRRVVSAPGNDNLRRQLFDVSAKLPEDLRKFVTDFSVALDKGVNAMRASNTSRTQLDVVGHLSSKKGQELQAMVSALPGKPDSVIKAAISQLIADSKGKSPSVQQAYNQLIAQAQGFIGSGATPEAPESKKKGRTNRLPERQERAEDALSIKADLAELKNAIKGVLDTGGRTGEDAGGIFITKSRHLTKDQLDKNLDRVQDALDAWVEDRTEQVKDQIKFLKLDPNKGRGKEMMEDLQREIDAKREEVSRDLGEKIAKALDAMVTAVEDVAKRAEEAARHQQAMAEARVAALDRADLQGKVPDYVRANAERSAAKAKDQADLSKIRSQETEIAGLVDAYNQISQITDEAQAKNLLQNLDPTFKSLDDLNDKIVALRNNTEELKASFGGEAMLPQTFNEAWSQAVQNFREAHNLTASWADMIKMNLGGAIETVSGAMEQFLTNVMSGTMSVREAFRAMVKSIISYLIQLIAKMIVVKILQIALGMGASSAAAGNMSVSGLDPGSLATSTSMGSAMAGLPTGGFLYGGAVKGAYRGEHIRDGVPNRDSVLRRLARDEFVMRGPAVKSLGPDFLKQLNERGASALSALMPKIVMPPPSRQEMNVYVVKEDEKPQLGPNDVLVVVANDILNGGQTKQLIKHTAQGG